MVHNQLVQKPGFNLDDIQDGDSAECGDKILVKGSGTTLNLNGDYMGWSQPEGIQWANVSAWDNRMWTIKIDNLETDGLPPTNTTAVSQTFLSFQGVIDELNNQLIAYGSTFRLIGESAGNRILLSNLNFVPYLDGDPYLVNFNNILVIIEDTTTGSDWLIKATNPKPVTLVALEFTTATGGYSFKTYCSSSIPVPVLSLGENFVLQHRRTDDYNTFINSFYGSTNRSLTGSISQDGNAWANSFLKVGVSFVEGNWGTFLSNKPMLFLEVLDRRGKSVANKKWVHPVNSTGPLNRTGTNYGDGNHSGMTTEWDITSNLPFVDQIIEIQQQFFYKNTSIILPQRWVDFIFDIANQLKYQRSGNKMTPTSSGSYVISTFKQPIRFRFGFVDPTDNKSIILGEPSEELVVSPKWGHFEPQDDTYIYDWQIRFHK